MISAADDPGPKAQRSRGKKTKVDTLEKAFDEVAQGVSIPPIEPKKPWYKSWSWDWKLALSACSLGFGVAMAIVNHRALDLDQHIKLAVLDGTSSLREKVSNLESKASHLDGALAELSKLLNDIVQERLMRLGTLSPNELRRDLTIVDSTVTAAAHQNIVVSPQVVADVGNKTIQLAAMEGGTGYSWEVVGKVLDYRSVLNANLKVEKPEPVRPLQNSDWTITYAPYGAPGYLTGGIYGTVPATAAAILDQIGSTKNANATEGPKLILIQAVGPGKKLALDGYKMRHVAVVNFEVTYDGGQFQLEDVLFVRCTFTIKKNPNGLQLATGLLKAPTGLIIVS